MKQNALDQWLKTGLRLAALLAMVLIVGVACGGASEEVESPTSTLDSSSAATAQPTAEPTQDAMSEPTEPARPDASPTATAQPTAEPTQAPTSEPSEPESMDGGGFGGSFTLSGKSYEIWCPEGGDPPPILAATILAKSLRLTCAEQSQGTGGLGILLVIADVTTLDGPFELTGPDFVGPTGNIPVVRGLELSAGNTTDTPELLWTRNMNIKSVKASGTYDGGTGRVVGTFEASFKASSRGEGEGTFSGTFDLAIPEQ